MFRLTLKTLFFLPFALTNAFADTPQEKVQKLYDAIVNDSPVQFTKFSAEQRTELFNKVANHPVASLEAIDSYDFQPSGIGDGEIGFCYGRAMTVHLMARQLGLSNDSIRKIFIAGELNNGQGTRWRFHMATLVMGDDDKWYVIDPIMPSLGKTGVIKPYEWMKTIKTVFDLPDGKDESHFFLTDTQSILVDVRVVPSQPEVEIQDRLIEPSFNPEGRPGFEKLDLQANEPSPYPVFFVSGEAQARYFILRKEPLLTNRPINDFDFHSIAIVITYQPPNQDHWGLLTRAYQYNSYFVDLVKSFTPQPNRAPNLLNPSFLNPNGVVTAKRKNVERKGPWLYGF